MFSFNVKTTAKLHSPVADIFLGSKITADGTAAMKLKDAPWKESYDQPRQHIKEQRHYLSTNVHLVKAMVFAVIMYGCEIWTTKKAERQRIDAFELWCWRRLLRVPWTARRSNQSIVKGDQPWDFFGGNDAEAETPVLWPPHAKS